MSEARAEVFQADGASDDLPAGWTEAKLGDFLPLIYGKALPARSRNESGTFPVFGSSGIVGSHDEHIAPEQSIIVGRKGTAGAVYFSAKPCWPIDTAYFAVPPEGFEPRYWFFQLHAAQLGRLDQSTAIPSLSRDNYNPIVVKVPPTREQKRIVSKIDELFSEIEAGERALRRARAALARYRKSVLKAAVTGDLTADWRAANKDKLEPAEKLLARILTARREAWEKAERAKLKAQGKTPKGEESKKKYREAVIAGGVEGIDLPESWNWICFDAIIGKIEAGKNFKCRETPPEEGETGVVKVSAVTWGTFDENESKTVTDSSRIDERYLIQPGDFLFSRANTLELVGASVITGVFKRRLLLSDKILRFRLAYDLRIWLNWFLKSHLGRAQVEELATGNQLSMRNISQESIGKIQLSLPAEIELVEIVSRVEEAFSKADHVEAALDEQERAARALKQSILKAAFEGRLVPQDPADEPAAKLLERIKKGRE